MTWQGGVLLLAALFWLAIARRRQGAVQALTIGDSAAARHLAGPLRQREIGAMAIVPTLAAAGLLAAQPHEAAATVAAGWFRGVVLAGVLLLLTEAAGLRSADKAAAQAERGLDLERTRRGAKGADRVFWLLAATILALALLRPF